MSAPLNPEQFSAEDVLGAFGGAKPGRSMEDHELLVHLQQHHGLHQNIRDLTHMDAIRQQAHDELPRKHRGPRNFLKSRTSRMVLDEHHDAEHNTPDRALQQWRRAGRTLHGHAG